MDKRTKLNNKLLRQITDDADQMDRHIKLLLRNNKDIAQLPYWIGMYRKASRHNNSELSGAALAKVRQLLKVS